MARRPSCREGGDTLGTHSAPTEVVTGTAGSEAVPAAELIGLEAAIATAVNAGREAHSLPPYRVDDTLAAVAQAHAQDMVARDYVGHSSPEGKRVCDRPRDAGLDLDRAGENYYVSTRSAEEALVHFCVGFCGGLGRARRDKPWRSFIGIFKSSMARLHWG